MTPAFYLDPSFEKWFPSTWTRVQLCGKQTNDDNDDNDDDDDDDCRSRSDVISGESFGHSNAVVGERNHRVLIRQHAAQFGCVASKQHK